MLLNVQRSGDSGSPRVIGSIRFSSAGHTSGCATSYGRLPALRRTLTTSSGVAPLRASSRPLRTVPIAMPVARATAATPPQPIAPASVPDHSRRARSSIVACNRHHFWRTTFSALAPISTVDHVGLILSIPCEVASGSGNASVGLSTLATCPVLRRSSQHEILVRLLGERRWPSGTIPSTAQRTARLLVPGFELADHSLGLVVEGGEDLVGVLFRVVKSQAADREIDDFMTVPRSRPG